MESVVEIRARGAQSHKQPLVGVIICSDSDLPVMLPAAHILDRFCVSYKLTIVSARRTPDRPAEYARSAAARGLRVICLVRVARRIFLVWSLR